MPKSIESELEATTLKKAWREWCEQVTDDWIKPRALPSPEHPSKKGFTREELIELARIARLGDDGFHSEITPEQSAGAGMRTVIDSMYREFGYTVGFLHHVREWMAEDDGFYRNKITGIRERDDLNGVIQVNARMFKRLKQNPFVAPWFADWCKKKNIAVSNPALVNALESTGRYRVFPGAAKESTRLRKT